VSLEGKKTVVVLEVIRKVDAGVLTGNKEQVVSVREMGTSIKGKNLDQNTCRCQRRND